MPLTCLTLKLFYPSYYRLKRAISTFETGTKITDLSVVVVVVVVVVATVTNVAVTLVTLPPPSVASTSNVKVTPPPTVAKEL